MKKPIISRLKEATEDLIQQARRGEIDLYKEIDDAIEAIEETLGVYERNLTKNLLDEVKGTYTAKCENELRYFLKKHKDKLLDACKMLSARKSNTEDVKKCVIDKEMFDKYLEILCNAQNDHLTLRHTFADYSRMDKKSSRVGFYEPYLYSMEVVDTEFTYLPIAVMALSYYEKAE